MKYYKDKRYKNYVAADDAGNCYTYEDREWLQTGWIKATWEETIGYLKRFISNPHYSQLISESDLKKNGIPPITEKTVRDQPAYEYYFGEHNHYVAKGDGDNRFVYKDGWWEYVHGLIHGMCQTATDEVLRGQLLYEKDLAGHNVTPVRLDNQICRLPDSESLKYPLGKAMDSIDTGHISFYFEVVKADPLIYKRYPEYLDDYRNACKIIRDYYSLHEKEENFIVENHGLSITTVAKNDKTGKLQQAVDTIKRIHAAMMEKNK